MRLSRRKKALLAATTLTGVAIAAAWTIYEFGPIWKLRSAGGTRLPSASTANGGLTFDGTWRFDQPCEQLAKQLRPGEDFRYDGSPIFVRLAVNVEATLQPEQSDKNSPCLAAVYRDRGLLTHFLDQIKGIGK